MFMRLLFVSFVVWLPNCSGNGACDSGFMLHFTGSTNRYAKTRYFGLRSDSGGMSELTTCFFVYTSQKTSSIDTIVSLATRKHDNELLIGLVKGNIKVWMFDHHGHGCDMSTNVFVSDKTWHHICFTWRSRDGAYSIYKDGVVEHFAKQPCIKGKRIPITGILVLGQDQDNYGGDFDSSNSFDGYLSDLNFWNSVQSSTKIKNMAKSCGDKREYRGNVRTWDYFHESDHLKNLDPSTATCCNL